MDSILISIKKLLGIDEDETPFDIDIMMHINTAIATLTQIGIGPKEGFFIESKYDLWEDFVSENLQSVKTYIYLKVKLIFDPPSSSTVIDSMERTIKEIEWRLNIEADSNE